MTLVHKRGTGDHPEEEIDTFSNPPEGKKKVTNIYWDQDTNEIVIEHD